MDPAYIIGGAVLVALVFWLLRNRVDSPLRKAIKATEETGTIDPLLAAVEELPNEQRSLFYQQAIQHLWNHWNRPLAVQLIRKYAENHSSEKICQFWLKQALEIEPGLARNEYDDRFLKSFYRPQVAKECGLTSS